ncbi:MAG: DUF1311 domain-containing protein [Bryobacteraceae bacterium]|nr:DUF1311 domain-containing protein [Bryobacteraceae bacterium]
MYISEYCICLVLLLALLLPVASGQTQLQINQQAQQQFTAADSELNSVYQEVRKKYASDTRFLSRLKEAQKAWLRFRDAQTAAMYPASDKAREYGSMYSFCLGNLLKQMTQERTKQLKVWLDGGSEGDACSGSVRR